MKKSDYSDIEGKNDTMFVFPIVNRNGADYYHRKEIK